MRAVCQSIQISDLLCVNASQIFLDPVQNEMATCFEVREIDGGRQIWLESLQLDEFLQVVFVPM